MSNALKFGPRIARTLANGGVSPGYIALYLGHHATTDPVLVDVSGKGNNGVAGAAFVSATAFASTDGLLTTDAANTDTTQKLGAFDYNFNNGDCLLTACRIKLATVPAWTKPIWSQGGNNSSAQGMGLRVTVASNLTFTIDNAGSTIFGAYTDQAGPLNDGAIPTGSWAHVMFCWWGHVLGSGANGTAYYGMWINGKQAFAGDGVKNATNLPNVITPTEACRIGQYYRTAGPTTVSLGATQASMHFLRAANSASSAITVAKLDALARRLYRDPESPLSAAEWPAS